MTQHRYTLEEIDKLVGLTSDEAILLFHLREKTHIPYAEATSVITKSLPEVRTILKSLDTKIKPLGYTIAAVLDTGFVLIDNTKQRTLVHDEHQVE